jgi:hypothetical protein
MALKIFLTSLCLISTQDAVEDTGCSPQRPSQTRLVERLTAPVNTTLNGQHQIRDRAIDTIAAYCFVEEGCTVNPIASIEIFDGECFCR